MLKKLKIVSLTAIAVIMIAGCNKSSDPAVKQPEALPKVSPNLRSFFTTRASEVQTNSALEKVGSHDMEIDPSQHEQTIDCQNGGTMYILNDFNQTLMLQNPEAFSFNTTSTFTDCIEDGTTSNGTIQFNVEVNASKTITTATFLTDMVIEDPEGNVTIKKDSFFRSNPVSDTESIETTSMESLSAEHSYKSENLKTHETTNPDGSTTSYDISGKQTVDGLTLIVDETYDASQTPMTYDQDGNLQKGGKARYTDEQNHTVMIEAAGVNKLKISVDENGDGKADREEVINY